MPSSTPDGDSSGHDALRITIRLYSILRHRDGGIVDQMEMALPEGSHVQDVLEQLQVVEELEPLLALNDELVEAIAPLTDGDRLSIIPSVAGGAT